MIKLNLGAGNPADRSYHPIPGWVNRDPAIDGWRFEDGLGDYSDASVSAISISHAAMYLPLDEWPAFLAECARVLADDCVLRITEDNTEDTRSRTYRHGWQGSQPAVTLTGPEMAKRLIREAGLEPRDCDARHTNSSDRDILQDQHGGAPHCFYVEGLRRTRVLFEPHADDGVLFAAFSILRYRPRVITCFASSGDYGSTKERAAENADAMSVLGAERVEQWGDTVAHGTLEQRMGCLRNNLNPSLVLIPHERASHPDHRAVTAAAQAVFSPAILRTYHTYDADTVGKVREGRQAPYEPIWVQQKLRALARFTTQLRHPRAHRFFMDDLMEYLGE